MNSLLFRDETQSRRSITKALVITFWFISANAGLYTFSFGVFITPDIQLNGAMVFVGVYWIYSLQFTRKLALSYLIIGLILLWVSDLLVHENAELLRWFSGTIFIVTSLGQLVLAAGNSNFWSLIKVQILRGPMEVLWWIIDTRR